MKSISVRGDLDPSCPDLMYELPQLMMTVPLQGCCRPDGICGAWADATNLGEGLTDAGGAVVHVANSGFVNPADGWVADPGPPIACGSGAGDGGASDASTVSDAAASDATTD